MVREILLWPDERLTVPCDLVTRFDAELEELAHDLLVTCTAYNGLGLAAPQVGVLKQVIVVIDMVMVNPVLTYLGERDLMPEGCLSFPGCFTKCSRYTVVKVEYQDIKGERHTCELTGTRAHVVQHEADHLLGIVIPDYLGPSGRDRFYGGKFPQLKVSSGRKVPTI